MKKLDLHQAKWLYPLLGGVFGIFYTLLDEGVLDHAAHPRPWTAIAHEFLDFILPLLLGASLGLCFYFIRREKLLSTRLSLKNDRLKQDLLFNTLISQLLHEIQNPLHNLTTALDESDISLPGATRDVVRRNLNRLAEIKKTYGQWGSVLENIDPEETVELSGFVRKFIDEKMGPQLQELGISPVLSLRAAYANIHPVFLEQILSSLLSNALTALEAIKNNRSLSIHIDVQSNSAVDLVISNSGAFPQPCLDSQGRHPIPSRSGLGLGLLLTRTLLEQVGGSLSILNRQGKAIVHVSLRAKST